LMPALKNHLFHFDLCVCLFWLFMNTRPVLCLGFGWIINCPCLSFTFFSCQVVVCIIYVL
jgi:hypothetical protein